MFRQSLLDSLSTHTQSLINDGAESAATLELQRVEAEPGKEENMFRTELPCQKSTLKGQKSVYRGLKHLPWGQSNSRWPTQDEPGFDPQDLTWSSQEQFLSTETQTPESFWVWPKNWNK